MAAVVGAAAAIAAAASVASAATTVTVANFENGLPAGWSVTPFSWSFTGATGTSPNILPPEGGILAHCGAPNNSSEVLTGVMTSAPITVASLHIEWLANGWSGSGGNGLNRFEILNAAMTPIINVPAPLSDNWVTQSVNLGSLGVQVGDTIYFRASDNSIASNYSWIAVDNIRFTGVTCPADLNYSGEVDGADLGILLGSWGIGGAGDLDANGNVDGADLGTLLAAWGDCPA